MAQTLPNVPVHNSSQFVWAGNTGTADLSDFIPADLAGRLYGDACDVGFFVVSGRSGNKVLFTEKDVERRGDEIVAYHYVDPTGNIVITVYND